MNSDDKFESNYLMKLIILFGSLLIDFGLSFLWLPTNATMAREEVAPFGLEVIAFLNFNALRWAPLGFVHWLVNSVYTRYRSAVIARLAISILECQFNKALIASMTPMVGHTQQCCHLSGSPAGQSVQRKSFDSKSLRSFTKTKSFDAQFMSQDNSSY